MRLDYMVFEYHPDNGDDKRNVGVLFREYEGDSTHWIQTFEPDREDGSMFRTVMGKVAEDIDSRMHEPMGKIAEGYTDEYRFGDVVSVDVADVNGAIRQVSRELLN